MAVFAAPILDGAQATQAEGEVRALVAALSPRRFTIERPGVGDGAAGLALFFLEAARLGFAELEDAHAYLDVAMEAVATRPLGPDLFGGFTGVGWTLARAGGEADDGLLELDASLGEHAARGLKKSPFDLIQGWVGAGVYALERGHDGRALLASVVHSLATHDFKLQGTAAWSNPPESLVGWQRELFPVGVLDLGVAHGTPGVAWLLARAAAAGVEASTARPLAEAAAKWVLAQRLAGSPSPGLPARLALDDASAIDGPARSAWCYGDPGAAVCLLDVARRLKLPEVEAEALALARNAAARPAEQTGVVDAGLCHGAAGLGHLYGRLFRATGEELFLRAARTWLGRAMALKRPDVSSGGFASVHPTPTGGAIETPDATLLTGAAGVGLALLSALSPEPSDWDRLLLADLSLRES